MFKQISSILSMVGSVIARPVPPIPAPDLKLNLKPGGITYFEGKVDTAAMQAALNRVVGSMPAINLNATEIKERQREAMSARVAAGRDPGKSEFGNLFAALTMRDACSGHLSEEISRYSAVADKADDLETIAGAQRIIDILEGVKKKINEIGLP